MSDTPSLLAGVLHWHDNHPGDERLPEGLIERIREALAAPQVDPLGLRAALEARPRPTLNACPICERRKCPDCDPHDWPPCEQEPQVCHGGEPCSRRRVDWRERLLSFDAKARRALRAPQVDPTDPGRAHASTAINIAAELVRHVCGLPEPRGKRHEDCASPEFVRIQAMRLKKLSEEIRATPPPAHREQGLGEVHERLCWLQKADGDVWVHVKNGAIALGLDQRGPIVSNAFVRALEAATPPSQDSTERKTNA